MNQTHENSFTLLEMGLGSITNMLADVSKKSDNIISTLKESFDYLADNISVSIGDYLKNMNINSISTKGGVDPNTTLLSNINENIINLSNSLGNSKESKENKSSSKQNTNTIKVDFENIDVIEKLNRYITGKFTKNYHKFVTDSERLEKLNPRRLEKISDALGKMNIKGAGKSFINIGVGILAIAGAVFIISQAASSPGFITGSITLLGLLWGLSKISFDKNFDKKSLLGLAGALTILTASLFLMQFIPFESIFKGIIFIAGLGLALRTFQKSPGYDGIMKLSFGIGILTASMIAMTFVEWQSIAKMLVFVGGLGIVLRLMPKDTGGHGLVSLSMGIGILTLSMFAMQYIPLSSMFKMLGFIGGLGLVLWTFPKHTGPHGLVKLAMGVGLLTLAMYAMKELSLETMFLTLGFITGLGLALKLYGKTDGTKMLMIAASIVVMAGAIALVNNSGINLESTLIFVGSIAAIAAIMVAIGIPAVAGLAITGAVSMVAVSISALLSAGMIAIISGMKIEFKNILSFVGAVGIIAGGFALITPLAIVALVGALAMLPVAVTAVLLSGSLALLRPVDSERISEFMSSAKQLALGFAAITPAAILGVIGAALMIPIAAASMASAVLLMAISKLEVSPDQIVKYNTGLKSIVETIDDFGVIQLTKAGIKSVLLLPIFGAGLIGAGILKSISSLNFDGNKIEAFGIFVNMFVSSMIETVKGNVKNLKDIKPGLKSLAKLVNVGSSLVDIVTSFANMNYNIYDVKDGKMVLVGTRKITDKEIQQVGINVGKLLQGLIAPLAIISSDSDEWDFGNGVKIKNPFKGGFLGMGKNSGIKRLTKISEAYLPLTEAILNLSKTEFLSDKKATELFKSNFGSAIDVLVFNLNKLENVDSKSVKKPIKTINAFIDAFNDLETDEFKSISDSMDKFINSLSDDSKWNKISKNLNKLNSEFKDIATNINKIDLEKALVLERNIKLLSDKNNNKQFAEVLEKISDMIGLLRKDEKEVTTDNQQVQTIKQVQTVQKKQIEDFEGIKELLSDIVEKIESTNQKLGGKLKVISLVGNSNKI